MSDLTNNRIENKDFPSEERLKFSSEYLDPHFFLDKQNNIEIKKTSLENRGGKTGVDLPNFVAEKLDNIENASNDIPPGKIKSTGSFQKEENWGDITKGILFLAKVARKRIANYFFAPKILEEKRSYYKDAEFMNKRVFKKNNQESKSK